MPTGSIVDASHSGAMFGSLNAAAPLVGAVSHNGPSAAAGLPDDDALMHPNVCIPSVCNIRLVFIILIISPLSPTHPVTKYSVRFSLYLLQHSNNLFLD